MNITLTAATLTSIIDQRSRIIWVLNASGMLLWCSTPAEEFLGTNPELRGRQMIMQTRLYKTSIQFRELVDPENRLDRIQSVLIDGAYVVCKKEQMTEHGEVVYSVLSDHFDAAYGTLRVDTQQMQRSDTVKEGKSTPPKILAAPDPSVTMDLALQVQQTLDRMGRAVQADRAYIFQFNWEDQTMSNTHEWCNEGVEPAIDELQNLPNSTFPWWQSLLLAHRNIVINDLEEFPPEAEQEKTILAMQGVRSVLVFPVVSGETLYGFLGFDAVNEQRVWAAADIDFLSMYSSLIAAIFDNSVLIQQVVDSTRRNLQLVDVIHMPLAVVDSTGLILETNPSWDVLIDRRDEGLDHIRDYVVKDYLVKFNELFNALSKNRQESVSGALISIEGRSKAVMQVQISCEPVAEGNGFNYLIVLQDMTRMLAYQSNIDRMHMERSQIFMRFADAFCKLYDRFDFEWPDHYLTARLSLVIAAGCSLGKDRSTGLYLAALLHDIGKIMLPKNILLKSERLSDQERMSVRRHIIGGADVLDQIEFPWEVARIIREQFEHRDGSGFPNGLTGSQMLIESQILFMVNMFISLTQSQNYRDPFTVDQAMEMMSEQAGLWFDQELFAVLTDFVEDNLRRLRLIKRSLNDIMITNYITFT